MSSFRTWRALATGFIALRSVAVATSTGPIVSLDYGSFQGSTDNATDSFLGVPYASPPVGDLRFRRPVAPVPFNGTKQATSYGDACPQQNPVSPPDALDPLGLDADTLTALFGGSTANASEDCLYLNIIRPAGVSADAKLPVVIWLYGGGFSYGDGSAADGTPIVERSIGTSQPIIYISLNYRVNAFGFLGGSEALAAGSVNVGIYDQRAAFNWVQEYISQFGGDPSKVILWGESAGSMSILAHMTAYGGRDDNLFRGVVMNSGYTQPIISAQEAQGSYDQLVAYTNCSSSAYNSSLDCLRQVPYDTLIAAINTTASVISYSGLNLTWGPRVEGPGGLIEKTFRQSIAEGDYLHLPVVAGECADEGTLFSLVTLNITDDAGFSDWVLTEFGNANSTVLAQIAEAYPSDPSQGSPFNTGTNYSITPEYKRIAAFNGDFNFQAPRRSMLATISQTQNVWGYLFQRGQTSNSILGAFHGSDLQEYYLYTDTPDWAGADFLANFAYRLDPNYNALASNGSTLTSALANVTWAQYNTSSPLVLTFEDPDIITLTPDTYRASQFDLINALQTEFGF